MRHNMPRLGEYWPSYWNSKMDLRRQFEFLTAMHVSTIPSSFLFLVADRWARFRLVLGPIQQINEVALESPRRATCTGRTSTKIIKARHASAMAYDIVYAITSAQFGSVLDAISRLPTT